MKKFVAILALGLLKIVSSGDSDELTIPNVTRIESENKAHSSSIYETIPAAARLVTAITLQNGLSDGSIKADDVIADLLNVGSLSLVELEKFDSEAANVLIEHVKEFPYEIELDIMNAALINENIFIDLHEIAEKWNTLKLKTKEVITKEDFTKLDEFNNWKIVSKLRNVHMDEIIAMLDDVIEGKNEEYESLKERLTTFVDLVPSDTDQYKNVESFVLSLIPFCEVFSLMKLLDGKINALRYPTANQDAILRGMLDIIPPNVSESLTIANKMLGWHSRRPPRSAPGFVNGYLDLKKLDNNTKYSWINKAIASIKNVNSVAQLEPTMEMFGNIMDTVSTPENRRTIGQLNTINIPHVLFGDAAAMHAKIAGGCPVKNDMEGSPLFLAITSLNFYIPRLLRVIYSLQSLSISITEKHREIITDLSAESTEEDLRELSDVMKVLKTVIEMIRKRSPDGLADKIHLNEKEITDFNTTLYSQGFAAVFDCIAEQVEPLKKLSDAFFASRNYRLIMDYRNSSDFAKRLNDIFLAIGSSSILITPLRAGAKAIEEDSSVNAQNLRNLSGLEPYTTPIAEAANVLVMIKKAKELKNEFAMFIEDGRFIQFRIGRYNRTIKHEIFQNWGNLDKTILEIVTFFAYINEWEEKLEKPSGTGIKEYGNSLKELATVPNVELDAQRRTIAVDKIQSVNSDANIKTVLVRLEDCLWKLSKLDLQFDGYRKSLEQMPDTLENVYKALHEYYSSLAEKAKLSKNKGKKGEAEGSDTMIFLFIFLGVLALVLIAGGVWLYLKSVNVEPKRAACRNKTERTDEKSSQSVR